MRDVKDRVLSAKYFIALSDDNQILGLTSLSDMGEGKAYANITAVSPKAKGTGIGTALYQTRSEFLKKNHYSCIISDTATNATSSVNWHLKKCGCHIIGYASFSSTNYYSFIFREDLNDRGWIVNHIVYPLHFLISYLATRLTKQQDGRYTKLGKIVRYIIDLKRERKTIAILKTIPVRTDSTVIAKHRHIGTSRLILSHYTNLLIKNQLFYK